MARFGLRHESADDRANEPGRDCCRYLFPLEIVPWRWWTLEFFVVEEGFTTLWASTMLSFCELLFRESQVFGFRCLPLHPVALETRVIW